MATVEPKTVEGLTQELEVLKASTSEWKKAVKSQLLEAQAKNQQLRQERDQLRTYADDSNATVRLQLDSEYRERFQLKDSEITRIQVQLTALRQQIAQTHEDHQAEIARVEEEKASLVQLKQTEMQSEAAKLQRQLSEAALAQNSLNNEIKRLKEEISNQAEAPPSNTSSELESLRGANRRLQQELANLRSQQTENEAELRDEIESHFQNEIELRDSQINILQTTLQQSRKDVNFYSQKARALQQLHESATEQQESKAASLRSDLMTAHTNFETLKQENEHVSSELAKMVRRCRDLEADRDARDILENDVNNYASSTNNNPSFSLRVGGGGGDDQARMAHLKEDVQSLTAQVDRLKGDATKRDSELEAKKNSLCEQEARIAVEMDKLKRQEQKSAEQLSQLVQQANTNLETLKKRQPSTGRRGGGNASLTPATFSLDNDGTVITDDPTFAAQENVRHWAGVLRAFFHSQRNKTVAIAFGVFFLVLILFSSSTSSSKSELKLSDVVTKISLYEQERLSFQKTIADLNARCPVPAVETATK